MIQFEDEFDITILEADGVIDGTHGYGYPIQDALGRNDLSSKIINLPENANQLTELPKIPTIISGGMTEVTADISWINQAKKGILSLLKENAKSNPGKRIPLLGICFGAQLIAEAYSPGSVTYLEDPEIGVSRIKLNRKEHPLFKGFPKSFDAYSFHYNQIKPSSFDAISKHQHMGHTFLQAFEIRNSSAYGVQFHPEFTAIRMKKLLHTYRDLISDLGFDVANITAKLPTIDGNHRLLRNFYQLCK